MSKIVHNAASVFALLACGAVLAGMALAPNDRAPEFVGRDFAGAKQRLDWSTHKLNLVNFWASWCAPCQRELPMLQELHDTYGDGGLRVLGISKDHLTAVEIADWLAPLGIEYTILLDDGVASRVWGGVGTLPTSFLIDSEGIVLRRYLGGAEEATRTLVEDVHAYMADRPLNPPYVPGEAPEVIMTEPMNVD